MTIVGITASSVTANLASIFSLATNSPSYKNGLGSNASVTHSVTDLANKIKVNTNTPTMGAFGWTL